MKFSEMPYERADIELLKKDFESLMKDFDACTSGEEQFAVHQKYYQITDHASTLFTIAEIRQNIDVTNEFYSAEKEYYDEAMPIFQNLVVDYQKKLYESPYRAYLEEKIGPVAFKNMELSMKSVRPELVQLQQEENSLTTRYNKLLASAKIPWRGGRTEFVINDAVPS